MALPISIESLLSQQKVESTRIEFKESWNIVTAGQIYRSVCAFANDIDNIGGGYIIVGIAEENGVAVRPAKGIPEEQLDKILKDILNYNHQIAPEYFPRVEVEDIDNQKILVLWVPSGENRPYKVYQNVASKRQEKGERRYYIRYANSTIEANAEQTEELIKLKNRTPFDERGNARIQLNDISSTLLRDHLVKVGSKLANTENNTASLLEHLGLMTGPTEHRLIKNVAGMMFCEEPQRFFPGTRAEIVRFPEGRLENPNYFIELPHITGSIPSIIAKVLDYFKTNIIEESVLKQKEQAESIRCFNYPYQALEEAVVNAFYHRDYQINEPVEIVIEPSRITILSHSGPDKTISDEALNTATIIRSRRYKNRRLGDFLKELGLTEGRATGIPTIQDELKKNGSPRATIETNAARSYFLIDIPCKDENSRKLMAQSCLSKRPIIQRIFEQAIALGKYTGRKPSDKDFPLLLIALDSAITPKSMHEIMEVLPKMNRSTVLKRIIHPLIEVGLMERTESTAIKSKKQQYIASAIAMALIKP